MRVFIILFILVALVNQGYSESAYTSQSGNIVFDAAADGSKEVKILPTGEVLINITSSTNTLNIGGNVYANESISTNSVAISGLLNMSGLETVNSNTTLSGNSVIFGDTSAGNVTLTLPAASSVRGRNYFIKKTSWLNQLWITSSSNINGYSGRMVMEASNVSLAYVKMISDGSQWFSFERTGDISSVVAADNLVGWWQFEETSGNIMMDSSQTNNHAGLQASGGNVFSFSGNSIDGAIGKALNYNGIDEYVNAGNDSSLKIPSNFTYSVWVRPESTGSDRYILGWDGNFYPSLYIQTNGTVKFHRANGALFFTSTTAIQNSVWSHIACSYDDQGNYAMYINGVLEGQGTSLHSFTYSWDQKIGKSSYKGGLDDVRIYNRVLSADEVSVIFQKNQ